MMSFVSDAAAAVWRRVRQYPVRFYGVVVSAVALASAFGLAWTAEQVGAVTAFTASLLGWVTEKFTTPTDGALNL